MKGCDSGRFSNVYNLYESQPPVSPLHRPKVCTTSTSFFQKFTNRVADDRQKKKKKIEKSNLAEYLMNKFPYLSLKT